MTLILALVVGALFAVGTYLILQRTLSRIVIGVALLGHGANLLLLLSGGRAGRPPLIQGDRPGAGLVGPGNPGGFVDPLPQALALTAIVIAFGVTAFLLTLAYRGWRLQGDDEVSDDVEDRRIARLARREGGGRERVAGGERPEEVDIPAPYHASVRPRAVPRADDGSAHDEARP